MATGFGLTKGGKPNSAGEEIQDIDWDSIPPDKRGMSAGQPQPKMKPDAALVEPDPFNESQLAPNEAAEPNDDDYSQISPRERKKSAGDSTEGRDDAQGAGNDVVDSQVRDRKKTSDHNNGVKVKKQSWPGKR